jgi:hypothetical protein
VNNCYAAFCHNQEQSGTFFCKQDVAPIAKVIMCYIEYFVTLPADGNPRYYHDEWSDRSCSYRAKLVSIIAQMSNQTAEYTNKVLSYLYWAIVRGKVKPYILSPIGIEKFTEKDWAYTGVFGSLYKITKSV